MLMSSGKELPEAIIAKQKKDNSMGRRVAGIYRYGAVTGIQPGGGGAGW
jgi:hypothetical protein